MCYTIYKKGDYVIKEKSKGLLIVVSGPSGAGKDTICNRVISEMKDTKISISMTSREPRGKEVDGVDYYFVSKEEFEERIKNDEFLEYAVVHNNQYYSESYLQILISLYYHFNFISIKYLLNKTGVFTII